jgi:ankyrin repeat protein
MNTEGSVELLATSFRRITTEQLLVSYLRDKAGDGMTPLHMAARAGHAKATDYLLELGARVHAPAIYTHTRTRTRTRTPNTKHSLSLPPSLSLPHVPCARRHCHVRI